MDAQATTPISHELAIAGDYQDMPVELAAEAREHSENRRTFLKLSGLSAMAAIAASCTAETRYSTPLVVKDEAITPGISYRYATTYAGSGECAGVLVKVRDGRPILVEGYPEHPMGGGVSTQAVGSVIGVYDPDRARKPMLRTSADGKWEEAEWAGIDSAVKAALNSAKGVRVLSGSIHGPASTAALNEFLKGTGAQHVIYDSQDFSAIRDAHLKTHAVDTLPRYRFDTAKCVVSFGADFLGSWLSPALFARDWASQRAMLTNRDMSRHYQVEANYSLTGANADERYVVKQSNRGAAIVALAAALAQLAGTNPGFSAPADDSFRGTEGRYNNAVAKMIAADLWNHRKTALVISDSSSVEEQMAINWINQTLEAYGSTIDLDAGSNQYQGSYNAVNELIADMRKGSVDTLFIIGSNPVYELPNGAEFAEAMKSVATTVYCGDRANETGSKCRILAPDSHYLESWNDYEPHVGLYTLSQPMIMPLWHTRNVMHSLLVWSGQAKHADNYGDFVKKTWQSQVMRGIASDTAWLKIVEKGFIDRRNDAPKRTAYSAAVITGDVIAKAGQNKATGSGDYEVVPYYSLGLHDGRQGNNAWLHEVPDPISRTTWENFVAVSKATCDVQGWEAGDLVNVKADKVSLRLPILPQVGMEPGTVAIAVGYGRGAEAGQLAGTAYPKGGDKNMQGAIGENAFPLIAQGMTTKVSLQPTGTRRGMAFVQTHDSLEAGRGVVPEKIAPGAIRETLLPVYAGENKLADGSVDSKRKVYLEDINPVDPNYQEVSLWGKGGVEEVKTEYGEHYHGGPKDDGYHYHWKAVINLNSCTGCSACVLACNIENNIPVVGKEEVMTRRQMHWLRIDRYYSTVGQHDDKSKVNKGLEKMFANMDVIENFPKASFQPMMCQHCNHAPCETVCPVNATNHSPEGLNQQVYNRCVGTRYCANNCPYKVRRFNWFSYPYEDRGQDDEILNLVLNPDVTIRTRGIMEKCTMCVQRINAAKHLAHREGRRVQDGDVVTACQAACPTSAIVVGNYNDKESRVHKLIRGDRNYVVIGEVGTMPNVSYLTKVRNPAPASV